MSCTVLNIVLTCSTGFGLTHNLVTGEMGSYTAAAVWVCPTELAETPVIFTAYRGHWAARPTCRVWVDGVDHEEPAECSCKPHGDVIEDPTGE